MDEGMGRWEGGKVGRGEGGGERGRGEGGEMGRGKGKGVGGRLEDSF